MFETFLFALMMVGIIRGTGFGDTTMVKVLVRDGMLAFVGLFCTCVHLSTRVRPSLTPDLTRLTVTMLLNTLLFTLAPTTLVTVGFP